MKKILIGVAVIIVIAGVGVGYIWSNLDELVRSTIEEVGSRATQTTVSLENVTLDLTGGAAALKGLTVGNPSGFKTPSAFSLGGVAVKLDPSKVSGEVVHINSIMIDAPKITYEMAGTNSNIAAIQKNVDAFTKSIAGGGQKAEQASGGQQTKLIIDKVVINGASVAVSADFLGGREMGGTLPTITLNDIGKKSGGASAAEVASQIISAITNSTTKLIGDLGVEDLAKGAMDAAKGAADKAKGALEGAAGGAAGVGDSLKGATEGLKNMFGN